jgi:PIN domain nuclease of toxin-antitoxin system
LPDTSVRFSAVSAWEIAIKSSTGKLRQPASAKIEAELTIDGFQALSVEIAHAEEVRTLPALHSDPFDRMRVAQAMVGRAKPRDVVDRGHERIRRRRPNAWRRGESRHDRIARRDGGDAPR